MDTSWTANNVFSKALTGPSQPSRRAPSSSAHWWKNARTLAAGVSSMGNSSSLNRSIVRSISPGNTVDRDVDDQIAIACEPEPNEGLTVLQTSG